MKVGILLINLGTPNQPDIKSVRKYLREFLSDARVIDISSILRYFLVYFIISIFRSPSSTKLYKELWTSKGAPLFFHTRNLTLKLAEELGEKYIVDFAMRYQNPSIADKLKKILLKNVGKLVIIPLYPQYASATTGSTIEKVFKELSKYQNIPEIRVINQFYKHPLFIKSWVSISKKYVEKEDYDAYLFSYHGLPKSQILKADQNAYCYVTKDCCEISKSENQFCYRHQCIQTTKLIVKELGIEESKVYNCFQSRLGKSEWIQPYAEGLVKKLAQKGVKKIMIFSTAFVADCLETTIEIGKEYKELFVSNGGKVWQLIPSLNDHDTFVKFLKEIIIKN